MIFSYDYLIDCSKKLNLDFHLQTVNETDLNDSLRMSNHTYPWSLRFNESEIVYNLLIKNNLKFGFEIATGFGVSTLAMAQALAVTNGKLVSMDAYVEEWLGYNNYDFNTKKVNSNEPDGYKLINNMLRHLNLESYVDLAVGWSPTDTDKVISNSIEDKKLDFAFIDGGHYPEQVILDVKSIINKFNDKALILFHDYGCVGDDSRLLMKQHGFDNFKNYNTKFNLVAHSKGNIDLND
jgi:predicted O-methyltransferase YrrM